MSECKHKFQPRYDKVWSTALNDIGQSSEIRLKSFSNEPYLKTQTYIYDICVKCGETVQRNQT